jgi:hypothetical protein
MQWLTSSEHAVSAAIVFVSECVGGSTVDVELAKAALLGLISILCAFGSPVHQFVI